MNENTSLSLAVAVLRVSTGEQVAGTSLPEQETACRLVAARDGFEVVAVCSDEGLSGTLFSARAGLQEAISKLSALRASHPTAALRLYFSAVDRATRDASVLPAIRAALRPIRAEVRYASVSIDNSPSGRFIEGALGSVAELERGLILHRTQSGKRARAREGIQTSRAWRPFGFDLPTKKDVYPGSRWTEEDLGRYFIREDEAALVRHVYAEYAAGRLGLRPAARWLNEQGSLTTHGLEWSSSSVYVILTSPRYKGVAMYGQLEHWREEVAGQVKRRKLTRASGPDAIEIPCPAIVDAETWERVQARMKDNKVARSGNPSRLYLLSGLVRCPRCGQKMNGRSTQGRLYYGCTYAHGERCGQLVTASMLESATVRAIGELVARPEVLREAIASFQKRARRVVPSASGASIRKALQAAERDAQNAARAAISAMGQGRDPKPYEDAAEELARKAGELRERLAAIGEETGPVKSSSVPVSVVLDVLGRAEELLSDVALPGNLRNQAIKAIVASVLPIFDGTEPSKGKPKNKWGAEIALRPEIVDSVQLLKVRWTVSSGLSVVVGDPSSDEGRGTP